MPAPELPPEGSPPPFEVVGRYPTLAAAQERALVVLAMGLPCWLLPAEPVAGSGDAAGPAGYQILAPRSEAAAVGSELALYEHERAEPGVPVAPELPVFSPGIWLAFSWSVALMVVFLWQTRDPVLTDLGASSSTGLVERFEWWRPFTALFLHAGVSHLVGNVALGVTFGVLVARSLGPVLGWLSIIASGAIGNALTAWGYYPEIFQSIGASTAVFAALGILTGYGVFTAFAFPGASPWRSVLLPIGGGIGLLGWFGGGGGGGGTGGGTTDVAGHIAGFGVGLLAGIVVSRWRLRKITGKAGRRYLEVRNPV